MRMTQEDRQELSNLIAKYLRYEVGTQDLVARVTTLFETEYPNAGPTWQKWSEKFEALVDALQDLEHEYKPGKVTKALQAAQDVTHALKLTFGGKDEDYLIP